MADQPEPRPADKATSPPPAESSTPSVDKVRAGNTAPASSSLPKVQSGDRNQQGA